MASYNIRKLRIFTIAVLALLAALIILFVPQNANKITGFAIFFGKSAPIELEDKCGRFINLFSHTIEEKKDCEIQCKSKCDSIDKSFRRVEFTEIEGSCNKCLCYCR